MAAKTVTFESQASAFNLVRQHKVQVPLPNGTGWQTTQKTVDYQFQPVPSPLAESGFRGVLTVRVGRDKMVDSEEFLEFGAEVGVERDAVDALMASRAFGSDFWVQGHMPGTIYPRPQEWRKDVILATAGLNDVKLAEMIAEERRTHGRVDLLEEAEEALETVNAIISDHAEQRAAEEKAAATEAAKVAKAEAAAAAKAEADKNKVTANA